MPEGPECRVVADAIQDVARNKVITSTVIVENVPGKIHRFSREKPKNWNVIEHNHFTITKVRTKGKLISLDITAKDSDANTTNWVLLVTLGMSGDFQQNATKNKHARYSFIFSNGDDLSFIDTRCFGTLRIVTPSEATKLESKLGWDMLQAPMPDDVLMKMRLKSAVLTQEIGATLLEQKYMSGHGNIYRAELLNRLGIHPNTLGMSLTAEQWKSINTEGHKLLQEAYKLSGCSVADFTANGKEGQAQQILRVYGKDHCPKGHPVKTFELAARTMWFCGECQQ